MRRSILPLLASAVALVSLPALLSFAGYEYPDPDPDPGGGGSCQTGDVVISTTASLTFSPSTVTVDTSQTVCIRNTSSMGHNFHVPGLIRCAGACSSPYNANDPASDPKGNWVTRLHFGQAGTLAYHCDAHGQAMSGQIIVQGTGGGGSGPGSLAFGGATYGVGESGSATITVRRTGGDDGAVSVSYATSNGTATAGSDYTARTGTLSWANGDDGNKTFTVPILGDTTDEPNETVHLTLSAPTGGATLGSPSTSTLTITDDDGGSSPPTAPAAPTGLTATAVGTDRIDLAWTDAASDETQFQIERKAFGGSFAQVGTSAANTPSYEEDGLDPATLYIFRVKASNAAGSSGYSNESGATTGTTPAPCVADADTLCFGGGRFQVELHWRFANGQSGAGQAVPLTDLSGTFYFANPNNLEMLIKVVNACGLNGNYWVFYAATTNVELIVTVTDTQTGRVKTYTNPLGTAAPPVQDTGAFACS